MSGCVLLACSASTLALSWSDIFKPLRSIRGAEHASADFAIRMNGMHIGNRRTVSGLRDSKLRARVFLPGQSVHSLVQRLLHLEDLTDQGKDISIAYNQVATSMGRTSPRLHGISSVITSSAKAASAYYRALPSLRNTTRAVHSHLPAPNAASTVLERPNWVFTSRTVSFARNVASILTTRATTTL